MNALESASSSRRAAFSAHAWNYASLGWPLVRTRGKRPFEKGWQTTTTVEPDTAASLWAQWGQRDNMGVVLGGAQLAVLEYDLEEARGQFFALLGGDLAPTPTCVTGSARHHVYFRAPGTKLRKVERDGLELRVGAHQCLVPPSEHPETGKPYQWLPGYEPWTLDPLPLPEHIVAFFERDPPQTETTAPDRDGVPPQTESVWGGRLTDARAARSIAALLELDFPRARCPLHDDVNPSGAFFVGKRGEWMYHCHAGCGTYSPPGLWLRARHGVRPDWLSRTAFAVWCRRLAIELGDVALADSLPALPATFAPSVQAYWDGYRLRVVCERLSGSDEWPTFAHDFAALWCGLPRSTARDARTALMRAGWLETTGERVAIGGREAHYWRPGPRAGGARQTRRPDSSSTRLQNGQRDESAD